MSIIGCGRVGMTAAYSMLHTGTIDELVLFGRDADYVRGEELDLEHAMHFFHHTRISSTNDFSDTALSDVVVITAGAAQKPGETRLELAQKNVEILESIIPPVVKYSPEAVIVLVSNPVDILTYRAYTMASLPYGRVIGTGTTLDTSRFRFHLSEVLSVAPRSIHAYILGEHGDHSFPALFSARVGGQDLLSLEGMSLEKAMDIYTTVRQAAYGIIEAKGATYYAIGRVVSHIVSAILNDAQSILPLSVPVFDYYGHGDLAFSMPVVVGRNGASKVLQPELSEQEQHMLAQCVDALRQYV